MATSPDHFAAEKADKALVLRDQGLSRSEIAERLGVKPSNIAGMIQRAKQRRKTLQQEKEHGHERQG